MSAFPKANVANSFPVVSIDADGAPSVPLNVWVGLPGYHATPPADIDFGNVPIGPLGASVFISVWGTGGFAGEVLGSSDWYTFRLSGAAPQHQPPDGVLGWTLTFSPTTLGPQQTTLTFGSILGTVCPPNTFIARGVGVAP